MANKSSNSRNSDTLMRSDVNSWKSGEVSSFYAARTPETGLKIAQNTLVEQNGTASDRGSFLRSDIDDLPFPIIGNVYVYKLSDNTENIICMLDDQTSEEVETSYYFPSGVGDNNNWVNSENAYVEDGIRTDVISGVQDYTNFDISIPSDATILGIELTSLASGSVSPVGSFDIKLSWDGGNTFTTYSQRQYHTGLVYYTQGYQLWGRTWSYDEFTNSNFMIRCTPVSGVVSVDSIKVRVKYVTGESGVIYTLNGNNWLRHDEITFNSNYQPCFTQCNDKIVIFNDKDAFSYYDITNDVVNRFAEVDDPTSALTAVKSGLSGTGFTIYYAYTYTGNGGETALSPAYSSNIGALRDNWGSTDYFTITRPTATDLDAIDWNLFMVLVPDGSGTPSYSDYELIKESIPLSTTVIVDNGNLKADTIRTAPENNTTAGIIAKYGTNINGRIWALHDHTVYWGGDTDHEFTFGGAKGSGYHLIDQYGKELPMAIQLGRDNSGTSCINLLTSSVAGQGSIYDIYYNTVTVNDTTIYGWEFKPREGNDGTNAPYSVIRANNNLYYLSLEGFKSTGVKPNITGIQSTDIISNAIKDKVQLLTKNDLKTCYSVYYDEKILWTVAYGTDENSQIWVYDILHGGIWSRWIIKTEAIFNWVRSNSLSSKLYIIKDQKVLYYQPNSIVHSDDGETFKSIMESGNISFKKDNREWCYLLQVIFVLLRPIGKVHFSITAHTNRGDVTKENVVDFGSITSDIGWNAITISDFSGTHNLKIHNEIYGSIGTIDQKEWYEVSLKFRKMSQYFSWKIWVEDENSSCMVSQVVPEYTDIGMGPDMLTRSDTIRI